MTRTILFVFAHPDDETFTSGGTLFELSQQQDANTVLYSATPGDAGKCGEPPLCNPEDLSIVRQKELEMAAKLLGINELIIGDYKDGQLSQLQDGVLIDEVINQIEQVKPDAVVTFPPHGLSGHQDHKGIQKATLQAVQEAIFPVKELYYTTVPRSIAVETGNPAYSDPDEDISLIKTFSTQHMEQVRLALLAHKTQHLSVERVFPTIYNENGFFKFDNKEYFIKAWQNPDVRSERVLF
ncbi:PIG-L family deacetylase [Pseudalkalibacillus hwajinpoensis]|uniref:PIG-L deacetylase family protein n=1 Tax=Guptibacillus hwajinpoensis TaxID=208199 RepID=UPI00325A75AE